MYSGICATVCYIYVYFSNPGGIFYDPVTQSDKGRLWWAQWKNYFFFSLILAFYQARVQGTQILLPTYRVPQWGWVMIFREKTDLSAQMTLTRKQKQILWWVPQSKFSPRIGQQMPPSPNIGLPLSKNSDFGQNSTFYTWENKVSFCYRTP